MDPFRTSMSPTFSQDTWSVLAGQRQPGGHPGTNVCCPTTAEHQQTTAMTSLIFGFVLAVRALPPT